MLPEIISKEPLASAVRQGDDQWLNVVRWTHYAMVTAEELGVTSTNIDDMRGSEIPEVRRLLGIEGDIGKGLGLSNDWAYRRSLKMSATMVRYLNAMWVAESQAENQARHKRALEQWWLGICPSISLKGRHR